MNAKIAKGRKIVSTVTGKIEQILAESIRPPYELPPTTDVEVRSHAFNENDFWAITKNHSHAAEDMPNKGKKKDLLSPFY